MKATKIKNISDTPLNVRTTDGKNATVNPGETLKNVDVANMSEVKQQAKVTQNLNE